MTDSIKPRKKSFYLHFLHTSFVFFRNSYGYHHHAVILLSAETHCQKRGGDSLAGRYFLFHLWTFRRARISVVVAVCRENARGYTTLLPHIEIDTKCYFPKIPI
jgi:hypothetical protein